MLHIFVHGGRRILLNLYLIEIFIRIYIKYIRKPKQIIFTHFGIKPDLHYCCLNYERFSFYEVDIDKLRTFEDKYLLTWLPRT